MRYLEYIQKKELFSSQNKEEEAKKVFNELKKQAVFIDNTNWMFENEFKGDFLENYSGNTL